MVIGRDGRDGRDGRGGRDGAYWRPAPATNCHCEEQPALRDEGKQSPFVSRANGDCFVPSSFDDAQDRSG